MTEVTSPEHSHLAVLGSPIGHSRSPVIHRAAYEVLGLPWTYEAIECGEGGLESLLASCGTGWRGFSVTMPLKSEAHRLSIVRDAIAEESGVVNTLLRVLGTGSKPAWAGFNTDVPGLAAALKDAALNCAHTIVLGAGATAVSAILAARARGAQTVTVLARRAEAAEQLAHRFDGTGAALSVRGFGLDTAPAHSVQAATAVISTLPGSAAAGLQLPDAFTRIPLFDVAYDPWPSPLAERWSEAGGQSHPGIGMLVHQALFQVRIFVNGEPTLSVDREDEVLEAMRSAGMGR